MAQDNRKILWIVDEKGNNGKTFLGSYLADKYGARIFENGRSPDIKYMWNGEEIVVFDLVRSCQDHINFEVIEQVKNGRLNSTKYICAEKSIDPDKHVKMICFTNAEPDKTKLSPDRWDVMKLLELEEFDLTMSRAEYRIHFKFLGSLDTGSFGTITFNVQSHKEKFVSISLEIKKFSRGK